MSGACGQEVLKAVLLGIIEGITEWLPVSSTGHMLLADAVLSLEGNEAWKELFFVLIQLGAVLAVAVLFRRRIVPLQRSGGGRLRIRREAVRLWGKIALACIPGALAALVCGPFAERRLHTPAVIAAALIFYGVVFLAVERWNRGRRAVMETVDEITLPAALWIGCFQILAIVPGTSRSGATIIGGLLLGVSRTAAVEFTFLMAVPVMLGMSLLQIARLGIACTAAQAGLLAVGAVTAFAVSLAVIRLLLRYLRRRDFRAFGVYRIVLGVLVLAYFLPQTGA